MVTASKQTLMRRAQYGGRKGRRAVRRLARMGIVTTRIGEQLAAGFRYFFTDESGIGRLWTSPTEVIILSRPGMYEIFPAASPTEHEQKS